MYVNACMRIVYVSGSSPQDSKDVSRMINERHAKRVLDLLDDKQIEVQLVATIRHTLTLTW